MLILVVALESQDRFDSSLESFAAHDHKLSVFVLLFLRHFKIIVSVNFW